jgi:hypothetical protein
VVWCGVAGDGFCDENRIPADRVPRIARSHPTAYVPSTFRFVVSRSDLQL